MGLTPYVLKSWSCVKRVVGEPVKSLIAPSLHVMRYVMASVYGQQGRIRPCMRVWSSWFGTFS